MTDGKGSAGSAETSTSHDDPRHWLPVKRSIAMRPQTL
jgi:hypothetical protein